MNICDFYANSFKESMLSSLPYILESIKRETRLDWTDKEDFELLSSQELFKCFNLYYFQYGIVSTSARGKNSHIFRRNWLFRTISRNNVPWNPNVQFSYALNIFIDGCKEQSRNVISVLLRNLSLQALNKSKMTAELDFTEIFKMIEIDRLCNRNIFGNKKATTQAADFVKDEVKKTTTDIIPQFQDFCGNPSK